MISFFPFALNAGQYLATGSSSLILPASTSCNIAVVVATTFVSEARSKIVSVVITTFSGLRERYPKALRYMTFLRFPIRTTAPDILPLLIVFSTILEIGTSCSSLSSGKGFVAGNPGTVIPRIKNNTIAERVCPKNQPFLLTRIMQTLFKNLFNLINLWGISLFVMFTKIFRNPSVKGTLRYQKIIFFTTSALSQLHDLH